MRSPRFVMVSQRGERESREINYKLSDRGAICQIALLYNEAIVAETSILLPFLMLVETQVTLWVYLEDNLHF